jgi:mRNA-degrading endonuclease toxin of MazEF toxin-antitoxin module
VNGTERPSPRRGEIWFVKLHVDPPDKGLRPVLVVSVDARNNTIGRPQFSESR